MEGFQIVRSRVWAKQKVPCANITSIQSANTPYLGLEKRFTVIYLRNTCIYMTWNITCLALSTQRNRETNLGVKGRPDLKENYLTAPSTRGFSNSQFTVTFNNIKCSSIMSRSR
jgi:hypothetical protein